MPCERPTGMRRKIAIPILLFGVAVVPGVLVIDRLRETVDISPIPPATIVDEGDPSMRPGLSTVFLPIAIPLNAIGARLNQEVPQRFSGNERDPVRKSIIVDDHLAWQAVRGPIGVWGHKDELHLAVNLNGRARLSGKARPVRGTIGRVLRRATGGATDIPFSVSARAVARFDVRLRPRLHADWRVTANALSRVDVQQATVPIAGLAKISVRSKVREALQRKADLLLQRLEVKLEHDGRLRRLAEREWAKLHRVERLSDDPPSWLVVRPVAVKAMQFRVDEEAVRTGLGIDAETRVVVAQDPPEVVLTPLPALDFTKPRSGAIEFETPGLVSWQALNASLARRMVGQVYTDQEGIRLKVSEAELAPSGDGMLLRLGFDAERDTWYSASGTLYLTARPRFDASTQTLHLDDLAYSLETRDSLVGLANWLLEPVILDLLADKTALDLSSAVERAGTKAQLALDRLAGKAPDGVNLTAKLRRMAISGLAVTAQGVQLHMQARADLHASVTRLEP